MLYHIYKDPRSLTICDMLLWRFITAHPPKPKQKERTSTASAIFCRYAPNQETVISVSNSRLSLPLCQGTLWMALVSRLCLHLPRKFPGIGTVAEQWPRAKQIYKRNGFANRRRKFSVRPCWEVIRELERASWVELSEWVRELLLLNSCEPLLWEAGSWIRGQFVKPEKGEHPPLEAVTEQRLLTYQRCVHPRYNIYVCV
jgi:hypothetical protein